MQDKYSIKVRLFSIKRKLTMIVKVKINNIIYYQILSLIFKRLSPLFLPITNGIAVLHTSLSTPRRSCFCLSRTLNAIRTIQKPSTGFTMLTHNKLSALSSVSVFWMGTGLTVTPDGFFFITVLIPSDEVLW